MLVGDEVKQQRQGVVVLDEVLQHSSPLSAIQILLAHSFGLRRVQRQLRGVCSCLLVAGYLVNRVLEEVDEFLGLLSLVVLGLKLHDILLILKVVHLLHLNFLL